MLRQLVGGICCLSLDCALGRRRDMLSLSLAFECLTFFFPGKDISHESVKGGQSGRGKERKRGREEQATAGECVKGGKNKDSSGEKKPPPGKRKQA